jgi:hypothetical protein
LKIFELVNFVFCEMTHREDAQIFSNHNTGSRHHGRYESVQLESNTEFVDPEEDLGQGAQAQPMLQAPGYNIQNMLQQQQQQFLQQQMGLMGQGQPQLDVSIAGSQFNQMGQPPMFMPPFQGNSLMGQMPPMPPMPGMSGMPGMPGMPGMMMPPMPPPPFPNPTLGQPPTTDLTEEAELEILALKRKVDMLNRELDRELSNSKLFEKKCEEYLNQLQRSADIIESLRAKHELESSNYDNRLQTLTDSLKDHKEKNYDLEDSNQRLNDELLHTKRETELDLHEKYEMKGQIDDNTRKNEYLEKDLNLREDKIQERTEEIVLLKRDLVGLEGDLRGLKEENFL